VHEKRMEIQTLRLSIREEEINALVTELAPADPLIENLRVRLTPEGVVVLGEYPAMLMKMAFETLWEVRGNGSVVEARLACVKVSGLPARMLRGVLLKTIRDKISHQPGVQVEEESIQLDLSQHPALQKLRLKMNLTGVYCAPEELVIEVGG
jgi:hypothetical protein